VIALPVPDVAGRPAVLTEAGDRWVKALERRPLRFLELHGAELLPEWQRRRMTPRRRERLEALALVGLALLRFADLVSYRIGAPRSDGYVTPPGHEELARLTGLTLTRLRRAIRDMVRAGYLRGPRRGSKLNRQPVTEYTNAKGERAYCAHRVVYVLTDKFFERLGLGPRMARERTLAVARRAAHRRIYAGALLEGRELAKGLRHGSREKRFPGAPGTPTRAVGAPAGPAPLVSVDAAENAARLVAGLKLRLRERHPDWGAARLEAETERIVRSTRPR
jgi:hypothetical protein